VRKASKPAVAAGARAESSRVEEVRGAWQAQWTSSLPRGSVYLPVLLQPAAAPEGEEEKAELRRGPGASMQGLKPSWAAARLGTWREVAAASPAAGEAERAALAGAEGMTRMEGGKGRGWMRPACGRLGWWRWLEGCRNGCPLRRYLGIERCRQRGCPKEKEELSPRRRPPDLR
jgi:hypothetical protein